MALTITKEYADGRYGDYNVVYWRITEVNLNVLTGDVLVSLSGYKDETNRDAGKDPIAVEVFNFNGAKGNLRSPANNLFTFYQNKIQNQHAADWGSATTSVDSDEV